MEGNPQTLPQIRIDDVEAEGSTSQPSSVPSARLIMICRLGTCVRSIVACTMHNETNEEKDKLVHTINRSLDRDF
jgi:hypothetical protein